MALTDHATADLAGWLPHHPDWPAAQRGRKLPAAVPLFIALRPPKSARQAITDIWLLRQVCGMPSRPGPGPSALSLVLRHFRATQQVARGITPAELQARGGWWDHRSAQAYFQRPAAAAGLAAALDLHRATPLAR